MTRVLLDSLNAWWPEAILSFGALLVILFSARPASRDGSESKRPADGALWVAWATLALSALALSGTPVPPATSSFFGVILCDGFSFAFRWFALGSVAFALLLVMASRELSLASRGECIGLLLLIGVGLMLMAEANHLLMAYLAMELVSLGSYLLVAFLNESRSAEASLKYLLFGALSSGIMLFGMSLLFGATGAMSFPEIRRVLTAADPSMTGVLLLAVSLMLAGLAFKISMVPFHMWTPDAYEGAPIAVAALLSVGPKAAGLALLIRVTETLSPLWPQLGTLLFGLTVVTMTFGNLVALAQTNVKRLLAYSTIGQVGYLLIGFVVNSSLGREAMFAYLIAYLFMNYGIFACLLAVVNETGNESVDAFRGLATRSPGLALLSALFLLSLAGIPPMLGFFGKLLLFGAALEAQFVWLAVAGIVNSAIALYYYVNLIRLMYFVQPQEITPIRPAAPLRWALGLCAAATIVLGLFPGALLSLLGAVDSVALPPARSAHDSALQQLAADQAP